MSLLMPHVRAWSYEIKEYVISHLTSEVQHAFGQSKSQGIRVWGSQGSRL